MVLDLCCVWDGWVKTGIGSIEMRIKGEQWDVSEEVAGEIAVI
jgi:hypothetical protein